MRQDLETKAPQKRMRGTFEIKETLKSNTFEEENSYLKVRVPRGGNKDLEGQRAN